MFEAALAKKQEEPLFVEISNSDTSFEIHVALESSVSADYDLAISLHNISGTVVPVPGKEDEDGYLPNAWDTFEVENDLDKDTVVPFYIDASLLKTIDRSVTGLNEHYEGEMILQVFLTNLENGKKLETIQPGYLYIVSYTTR